MAEAAGKDSTPQLPPVPSSRASQRSHHSSRSSKLADPKEGEEDRQSLRSSRSSRRSVRSSVTGSSVYDLGSERSITSSEAMNKLQLLEKMLSQERKAREQAESTLLMLERERKAKEEAQRRSDAAQKQLSEVMLALQDLVGHPTDAVNIRKLQSIVRGKPTVRKPVAPQQPPTSFLDAMLQQQDADPSKTTRTGLTRDHTGSLYFHPGTKPKEDE
jgi:hypothetical protein